MKRSAAFLVLVLALSPLFGCSTNPATGERSFTAFMSPEKEIEVGRQEHGKATKEFGGVYREKDLDAYIDHLGHSLAAVSEMPNLDWTFTLLNSDVVNAFALPGGYVYVTRGIMALAENEAELAGVLAHEIGHVTARHSAQRYSRAMATNIGLAIFGIGAQAAGLPAGLGDVAAQGAGLYLMAYSRDQELQADQIGVRYMSRAGYDPEAMVSFFQKLEAHTHLEAQIEGRKETDAPNAMATHPRTADRIRQAMALAEKTDLPGARTEREAYLDHIDGIIWGDDPEQGIVKGRTFIHPDLRIQFTVPEGFTIANKPNAVLARGPNQALIIFDMAGGTVATDARSLSNYLTTTWAKGRPLDRVETLDINGMQAVTGTLQGRSNAGVRDLRLIAIRGDKDRIYRLLFVTPPNVTARLEPDLQRMTYSLRGLSAAEAQAAKPLRLRVVRLEGAQTPESLAARMPFEKYSLAWFDVLNGLSPDEKPRPGERVKIVTDSGSAPSS